MRAVLCAAILCLLLLAACNSAPQPTATPVPPTQPPAATAVSTQVENQVNQLAATAGIPQPGTLIVPTQGDGSGEPTQSPITIDSLVFSQTGGIAGISLTIQLNGDGTLTRSDGRTTPTVSQVSPEDMQKLGFLLDNMHFYDLQGVFTGSGSADAYQYTLTVDSGDRSRTISSQDGATPPQLSQVYDAIRNLASASTPTPAS